MAEQPTRAELNAAVLSAEAYVRKCRNAVDATRKVAREARTNYQAAKQRAKAAPKVKRWRQGAQVNYERFEEATAAHEAAVDALDGAVDAYDKVVAARAKILRPPPKKKAKKKAAKKSAPKPAEKPNPEPAPAPNTTEGNGAAAS